MKITQKGYEVGSLTATGWWTIHDMYNSLDFVIETPNLLSYIYLGCLELAYFDTLVWEYYGNWAEPGLVASGRFGVHQLMQDWHSAFGDGVGFEIKKSGDSGYSTLHLSSTDPLLTESSRNRFIEIMGEYDLSHGLD